MKPKISIVIPCLNHGEFLEQALRSLIFQRNLAPADCEIIVIDGGSTDQTIDVIRRYRRHISWFVSEPDSGQTEALIKGFRVAAGEILGWLCADDLLESYTLSEVVSFFDAHPEARFIYGDAVWVDREGRYLRPKKEIPFIWFLWLYCYNYIPQPAAFWRKELYDSVGGLDARFALAMDGDLWARFAERTQPIHVRRVWARMRWYAEQKNQRLRSISDREDAIIRRRYGVHDERLLSYLGCRLLARACRVCWKLATACYW
jgi:glycosyltransferase involved in cell wall biosynthesis